MPEMGAGKVVTVLVMTTTQRDALAAVEGMVIFNSTTDQLEEYDGSVWQAVGQVAIDTHAADVDAHHEAQPTNHKARAYPSADQTIPKEEDTTITLDTEDYDPGSHFASNKYTVAKAGVYQIIGEFGIAGLTDGKLLRIGIYINGTRKATTYLITGGTANPVFQVAALLNLAFDDYIELKAYHDNASNIDSSAANTSLAVHLLSA